MAVDDEDRFFHDLEVLEECRELLLSGSGAQARMALILLDSLADALLHRRLERAYAASEELWYMDNPRFPKSVRRSARQNFGARLRLAQQPFLDLLHSGSREQLVSELEADVLLIGHSYRNAAYHRDTHNPALIAPLGKAVYGAVAAAFARGHDDGLIVGLSAEWMERLDAYGVDRRERKMLTRGDAAKLVAARLREGLDVPVDELAVRLADDLERRGEQVEGWISQLPLDEAGLDAMLAEQEFWDKHGADDELMRLVELRNPISRAVRLGIEPTSDMLDEAKRAEPDFRARVAELKTVAGPPTVSLAERDKAGRAAEEIRQSRDLGVVLHAYQNADHALCLLEEYVGEALSEYDRHVQLEIDIARGK